MASGSLQKASSGNMEQNRRAYTEESQQIIRRQQSTIKKMKKDNEKLKAELAMEQREWERSGSLATNPERQKVPPPRNNFFRAELWGGHRSRSGADVVGLGRTRGSSTSCASTRSPRTSTTCSPSPYTVPG